MVSTEKRGAEIRQFILENVEGHPTGIVTLTAQTFGISRQGVHRHMQRLVRDAVLQMHGKPGVGATRCDQWPSLSASIA